VIRKPLAVLVICGAVMVAGTACGPSNTLAIRSRLDHEALAGAKHSRIVGIGYGRSGLGARASHAESQQVPVLGYVHFEFNGRGYGHPHPKRVFNGGDPAGLVDHLSWTHWGDAKTYGLGKTYTYKPHGGYYPHEVRMRLRASDLGSCHGKRAYRSLYYREQTKPGGEIERHWLPWGSTHGNICKPIT
jgi:hypothetical protein